MEGKSKYSERLQKMQNGFSAAQRQSEIMNGNEAFPKGVYVGRVTAKLRESKAGNLMVNRMFVPTEGDMLGVPCYDNLIIEHPNEQVAVRGMRDLMRFLDLCNYQFDPKQPEQLEEVLEALSTEAPVVKFEVRHSGQDAERPFVNVSVLELVGRPQERETPPSSHDEEQETPAEEVTANQTVVRLREFLTGQGVAFDDTMDETALVELMQGYEYKFNELTENDVKLLESYDLSDNIIGKPAPKATPKAAPKVTAKSTGKGKRR